MTGTLRSRLTHVRRELKRHKLDGLLVTGMANVRYLTGFSGSQGMAVLTPEAIALVVDFRYFAQAASEAPGARVIHVAGAHYGAAIAEAVQGLGRVAFEADTLSYADALAYQSLSPEVDWVPSRGLVETSRMVKDAHEIARLRAAGHAVSEAVMGAIATLHAGMTERELAAEIDRRMRLAGAEANAFETLVASGARSALPHPYPSDQAIAPGDWLLIDAGAVVDGYRSDMTRTFVLGKPDPRQRLVWECVYAAM
ncbi:MAG TPA: Xaa-Pro peptidase family protein, partial [Oscillatoriaceae cyanobacterium]